MNMTLQVTNIKKTGEIITQADALLITAGAGMGVDSGLPDFRGDQGFWKAYPPMEKLGISFVEMANPQWFTRDPGLAWGFYGHRLHLYRETKPHEGFTLLHQAAVNKTGGYFVFTSNVDGQFQKAGFDDLRIEECHGSLQHLQCVRGCSGSIWSADKVEVKIDMDTFRAHPPLPACPDCGGLARPNVLMFGDWGWVSDRTEAQGGRFACWLQEVIAKRHCICVVEIGAGRAVPTVRITSENVAGRLGGTLIRINPRDYGVPAGEHFSVPLDGLEGIRKIIK